MLVRTVSFQLKELYNPKAFFTHAAWLDQGCPHCPKFPTAASRRSLGRVSVPVWPVALSGRLPVVALVGHHPTNKLIGREPIPGRKTFHQPPCGERCISGISPRFRGLSQSQGQVAHVLLTRSPLVYPRRGLTVRLACVKHAASVRPEPGSNSPLKSIQIRRNDFSAGFVVSTSSIADRKTHAGSSSINQRNPNSDHAKARVRARGCALFGIDF